MNQKGNIAIVVVALIAVAVAAFFLAKHGLQVPGVTAPSTQTQQSTTSLPLATPAPVSQVNTPQDLNTVSNQLDNTNLNVIDNTVSQNNSDSTNF